MPPDPSPPNTYPIELVPPDIERFRNADGPFPWVSTWAATAPGPHVAITAVVHGNEPCGAIALDWLLQRGVRPLRGRLSLAMVNVDAYLRFDPEAPTQSRWVDEDLNRVWDEPTLAGERRSRELERARQLRPWLDGVDLLLDLHSMQHASEPLTLAGSRVKGLRLAQATGVPALVVSDAGHAAGRRLRDYGAFDDPANDKAAILVECGQHWAASSATVAIETAVRFLRAVDAVAPDWQADAVPTASPPPQRRIEVTEAVTIKSGNFSFTHDFRGLEVVAKAGTVIAEDDGDPIRTPYDGCVLIMPNRRLMPGFTAVRLGRYVD